MAKFSCLATSHKTIVFDHEEYCITCMEEKEQRLRGQLQNCVNHLEKAKRSSYGKGQKSYEDCIAQANKVLYETLHT